MIGDGLADAQALSLTRNVPPATVRVWAHRYPDELPAQGKDRRGRTLYRLLDFHALADRLGRVDGRTTTM